MKEHVARDNRLKRSRFFSFRAGKPCCVPPCFVRSEVCKMKMVPPCPIKTGSFLSLPRSEIPSNLQATGGTTCANIPGDQEHHPRETEQRQQNHSQRRHPSGSERYPARSHHPLTLSFYGLVVILGFTHCERSRLFFSVFSAPCPTCIIASPLPVDDSQWTSMG